jgi:hypothetical protein
MKKIKILSFSCEIKKLRNNNIFLLKNAQKYPGALWIYYLKSRCQFDLEFQTIDLTLKLIKDGKVDPSSVAVFQHNIDKEAEELIGHGAHPFFLSMYESPLYCGKFYDSIERQIKKFHHVKIFGAHSTQIQNLSQAFFPCYSLEELSFQQQTPKWDKRGFASMVMGNKYVLTRPFSSFKDYQDRIWWVLKFIRQYIKGPTLPKKIHVANTQLQDARYEIMGKMLSSGKLDLYGNGWDKLIRIPPSIAKKISTFLKKNRVIAIENKIEIISAYKFNVCFENISYPGYITEKIFDAFLAKTIPIYYGAPDISRFIPSNTFIDASKFKKVDYLIEYISKIESDEGSEIIENGQKFLRSSQGMKFSYENIADEIIYILDGYLNIQPKWPS